MSSATRSAEIVQLIEVTGVTEAEASNLLEMHGNNLEQAINYHLEVISATYDLAPAPLYATVPGAAIVSATLNNDIRPGNCFGRNLNNDRSRIVATTTTNIATTTKSTDDIVASSVRGDGYDTNDDDDDHVRPPIPVKREQLIMPEDDNFRLRKRRAPAFSVCPLRNFAREAEIQEEQLNNYLDAGGGNGGIIDDDDNNLTTNAASYSSVYANRGLITGAAHPYNYHLDNKLTSATDITANLLLPHHNTTLAKRARLEDLFRPPVDLLFWGTFRAARDYATSVNRWLIVNLQDHSEFKSQIINRDIWSDQMLKRIVEKHFVLWQVSVDNPEGLRFKTFYKVEMMPYVCIIDPRTGEEKQTFDVVTSQTFAADLNDYLSRNSYTLEERDNNTSRSSTITSSRIPPTATVTKSASTSSSSSSSSSSDASTIAYSNLSSSKQQSQTTTKSTGVPLKSATELSEEDQVALAIQNSLKETRQNSEEEQTDPTVASVATNDDSEDVIELTDSDDELNGSYENYLGSTEDPETTIQLRLPDGEKTVFIWPSTTSLRAIKLYVQSKYSDHTKEPYKIINAFPRQNILDLDENISLIDAQLHPRAILHLHPDN